MGKLVIFLAFSLGALLMLESVQAGKDCNINVIKMTIPGNKKLNECYTVEKSTDYEILKESNPLNKLEIFTTFHVSDCKAALDTAKTDLLLKAPLWFKDAAKTNLLLKAPLWFKASNHEDVIFFSSIVYPAIKPYLKKLPIAMAEGDDDDNIMIDHENSQICLRELLSHLPN